MAIIAIILLEFDCMHRLRQEAVLIFSFLKGKRAILSNIFLGIFASAFCMFVGECVNLKYMQKELENEIRELFDEIWVKITFKSGMDRQSYIDNSQSIVPYQGDIRRLLRDYEAKKSHESLVIFYLDWIAKYYKAIYENEYMKNSNIMLFHKFSKEYLQIFDGDIKKMYSLSVFDDKVMELRQYYEKILNDGSNYKNERDKQTDEYIKQIKKVEGDLNTLYEVQIEFQRIKNEKELKRK